ncbi:MAG TPA: hypothetical protein PKN75_06545 [Bacteroidia bacterium]|nr:hypothetical protein [Bacteroidia bacterium]HNU33234.1 hypothetical protein [Bacteroidia bacterium]
MRVFIKSLSLKLFFLFLFPYGLSACDICGGFMGITPYDNQSNIGLYYRLRTFSNYYGTNKNATLLPSGNFKTSHLNHDNGNTLFNEDDYEEYRVLELRGKFFLHERIEITFSQPYYFNSSNYSGHTSYLNGTGDLSIIGGWHLVNKSNKEKFMYRLVAGLGIKLPTGNYQKENNDEQRYSILMQPGTGSADLILHCNYLAGYKNLGANLISAFRINSENKFNEKAGNGLINNVAFFYKCIINDRWTVIPSFQNYYEYSNGIYYNDVNARLTKMNVLYSGAGVDVFYKNIQWSCVVQVKTAEERMPGKMQSALKITTGIVYNFSQEDFVIKSKTK